MKAIVIYNSQTGFTKEYGQWIAEELGCEAIHFADRKVVNYADYDTIIFGSWVQAGGVKEKRKITSVIKKNPGKKFAVYVTGCMPAGTDAANAMVKKNFPATLANCESFYFRGGLRYEKMTKTGQRMMAMLKKMLSGKKNPSEGDKATLEIISNNFEGQDKSLIDELIKYVRG